MQVSEDKHKDLLELANRIAKLNENLSKQKNLDEEQIAPASKELISENEVLKKELDQKNKTIKELGYKIEMLKMAKGLKTPNAHQRNNEELKKTITEYIKEIDKNILSLNAE